MTKEVAKHKGIKLRHKLGCAKSPCTCEPSFRPSVYDRHAGRKLESPTFKSLGDAKQWRVLKAADVERGQVVMVSAPTLRSVAEEFLVGAERGAILNHEQEAARMLDEYLARADTAGRVEQITGAE